MTQREKSIKKQITRVEPCSRQNAKTIFITLYIFYAPKWNTRGLLESIRTKNKLFNTCCKNDDVAKKQKYKKYLNKLTHLKNISKRIYYESLIKENQNSPHKSWSVINEIIDYKNDLHKSKLSSSMKIDDHIFSTDSQVFLEKMADYFANIGAHMNKEISKPTHSTIKIYS